MGYHNAVDQYMGAVKFANKAINDRERFRYALSMVLNSMDLTDEKREIIIKNVRGANFEPLKEVLKCL